MTLTLKMTDLLLFRTLVGKLSKPSEPPMVCFIPGSTGLKLAAFTKDATLVMSAFKQGFIDPFAIQWDAVKELTDKKMDVGVTFTPQKDSTIHVEYAGGQRWYAIDKKVNTLPKTPSQTVTHSKRLVEAIQLASRCTDSENPRYAIGGICFRSEKSQIISTSGSQALVQDNFQFPWDSDVLCPTSRIFACKDLFKSAGTDEVLLGQVDGSIYFRFGTIELYLRSLDGRFPKVDQLLTPADGSTYLNIHPTDAAFLIDRMDKLPGKKDSNSPIWLSTEDKIQIRAFDKAHQTGMTLPLDYSTFLGEPVSLSMNRAFLQNALRFGCLLIAVDPAGATPMICTDEGKTFICMTLDKNPMPEIEAARMSVITSSTQATVTTPAKVDAPVQVKRRRRVAAKSSAAKPTGNTALLQTAEQIRQDLRNSLVQVNVLIKEVKAQRNQDRLLRNTMDSLRKLSLA